MLLGRGCFSVASGPPELVLVVKEPMTFDRLDQLELSVTHRILGALRMDKRCLLHFLGRYWWW
jgi:hypothetical protein